ncbi:MAG: Gfo/Idh/MocA family oxidoreductase, partial [Gammaproteobacteria bacterium]|nr:Gfo/Idh/MocA family oxidoreductase [Gammaproteobacteria bacterium]
MTKLQGVAVGAGYFSQFHFDAWSRLEDVHLSAICDLEYNKAENAAKQYGVGNCYTDFVEMLDTEKPDFVDIISRPDSHLALTRQAVDRGVAVICQKPLAPTFEEARELVGVADTAHIRLMVHENFRFQPWYREIKRLLESQTIGDRLHTISFRSRTGDGWQPDAYLARQPYFRTMPRFLIFEMGVHFIDTFRFLAGEIDGVYASLRKLNADIAGEDAATVHFEFSSGAEGIWDANRFNEASADDPRYTFGEALVECNGGSIRLYSDGSLTVQRLGESEHGHVYEHGKKNFASDCVLETQRHFVQCLKDSRPF